MQEESSLKFAERLKIAMAESGLKAARLAAGTGISKGYLSELLKGHKEAPSFEVVKKFAEVLGCSPRWLLTGHEAPGLAPSPAPHPSASSSASSAPPRFDSSSSDPELMKVLAGLLETNRRIATALERLADQQENNL